MSESDLNRVCDGGFLQQSSQNLGGGNAVIGELKACTGVPPQHDHTDKDSHEVGRGMWCIDLAAVFSSHQSTISLVPSNVAALMTGFLAAHAL